jgi:AcrR family transcriptional regulator
MIIPITGRMTDRGGKRQDILDTTLRQIVQRGLEATPMSLIAQEAGVGMGTIYHHFSGKDELVNMLYRELKQRTHTAMMAGHDRSAPVREQFFRMWRNLFDLYLSEPDLYRFLTQYSFSPTITQESKELGMQLWQVPIQLIEQGRAQQMVKPLPTELLMLIANAPLANLVQGHIDGRIHLDDASMDAAITACWDAIKL